MPSASVKSLTARSHAKPRFQCALGWSGLLPKTTSKSATLVWHRLSRSRNRNYLIPASKTGLHPRGFRKRCPIVSGNSVSVQIIGVFDRHREGTYGAI